MGWNPFDRRSDDQKTIDDALVGLQQPEWVNGGQSAPARFVRQALSTWRSTGPAEPPTDVVTAHRVNRVRQAINRDRGDSPTGAADVKELMALRNSVCGSAVHAVVVLASSVDALDAWRAREVEHRIVRIDLTSEVQSVARSASHLHAAFLKLGAAPGGHLADDAEVQEIYTARRASLFDRQRALCSRITAMRHYLDGLTEIQRELEKMRWIERHGSPDLSELIAREGDELASYSLEAARDMFDAATDRIGHQLSEAAEQLSRNQ